MKTIRNSDNAAVGGNSIIAAILFATIFSALPALVSAQSAPKPAQIVQYEQQIAQVDAQIAAMNNEIAAGEYYIRLVRQWLDAGAYTRDQVPGARQYIAQSQARIKYLREQAIPQLQNTRAWLDWGIRTYYNPGGGGSVASQNPGGSAGNAGQGGLLGTGPMQKAGGT